MYLRKLFGVPLHLLFDKTFLIVTVAKQSKLFKCIPVDIAIEGESKDPVFKIQSNQDNRYLKYKSYVHSLVTGLLLIQCLTSRDENLLNKIIGWLYFLIIFMHNCYLQSTRIQSSTLNLYLDNLLSLNKTNINGTKENISRTECLNLLIIPMLFTTCTMFGPIFVLALHLINPCMDSLAGYFLLEECYSTAPVHHNVLQSVFWGALKTCIFTMNLWIYYFGFTLPILLYQCSALLVL